MVAVASDPCAATVERVRLARSAAVLLLVVLGPTACTGRSCDALPELRAERDTARADYLELVRSGEVTAADTEQADDALHALEREAYDLEQECEGR
jgi:hypothetical protein